MTASVAISEKSEIAIASEALRGRGDECRLQVFGAVRKRHALLDEIYFLNRKDVEPEPDWSSQAAAVTSHANDIHGRRSRGEAFLFEKLHGIGGGRSLAPAASSTSA